LALEIGCRRRYGITKENRVGVGRNRTPTTDYIKSILKI
jgi:hypothetical protein